MGLRKKLYRTSIVIALLGMLGGFTAALQIGTSSHNWVYVGISGGIALLCSIWFFWQYMVKVVIPTSKDEARILYGE